MFSVGEFARLAQVSKRLLRYYDELGLFRPAKVDPVTGFRYYSAAQMSALNRILVLKDIGLSLDQIQRTVEENVSAAEMQGMLIMKRAEIEQRIEADRQRIRRIESRLQMIRDDEAGASLNVVIKSMPAASALSLRTVAPTFEAGFRILRKLQDELHRRNIQGIYFCICHGDDLAETDMDLELGCFLERKVNRSLTLDDHLRLAVREFSAVAEMATTVVSGPLEVIHMGYARIGKWAEDNGYRPYGLPREVILQMPQLTDGEDLITEIQFPVLPEDRKGT